MQPKEFIKLIALLFVVSLFVSGASRQAISQTTGGTLRGIVKDSTSAVIPDAVITATNEATGTAFRTVTSSAGLYSFPNLLVGSYSVLIEHAGFKKSARKNVAVSANRVVDVETTMEVGALATIVEVVGGADLVSLTTSQFGATMEERAVRDLPNSVLGGSPI
jgi:hypothetical protein